jgi:putative addiction module component (TIGR02574 family)
MPAVELSDIRNLSVAERIQLVEDIWDSVVADAGDIPIPEPQRLALDERLAEAERDPGAGSSWDEVKATLLRRA